MEKKARVKRLNHQDDVKRSWAAAYSITEEFEDIPEDALTSKDNPQPSDPQKQSPDREALPERYRSESQ
jgi:hypothetical protein